MPTLVQRFILNIHIQSYCKDVVLFSTFSPRLTWYLTTSLPNDLPLYVLCQYFNKSYLYTLGWFRGQYVIVCALSPLAPHLGHMYALRTGQITFPVISFRQCEVYKSLSRPLFLQNTQTCREEYLIYVQKSL